MIDEYWTWIFYGYHSDELSHGSGKPIVAVCEDCGRYRVLSFKSYKDFCIKCFTKGERHPFYGKHLSEEHKHNISKARIGKKMSIDTKKKISKAGKHRRHTEETKRKMSKSGKDRHVSDETRQKLSASHLGIPYEEWTGYAIRGNYCEKFNDDCKERNREKYDNLCYMCGKKESENVTKAGLQQSLSVHHVDMDRGQGCDGVDWKLVPLCMSCHSKSHTETWTARIEYLLNDP